MSDLPDYELRPTPVEPRESSRLPSGNVGLWIAVAVVAAAIGAAAYYAFFWKPRPGPAAGTTARAPVTEPLPALGGTGDAIAIPPIDESDSVVRTLVQALSESPAIMAWLPTNGLIRNFTVVVTNIADGATPAKQLRVLKPSAPFRVVERGGTYADSRSYDRYNSIADAVASIDPAAAAKLYATLKPRIEEAHRDLAASGESFDRTLERAIVALLDTPNVDTPPRLRPKGIGYGYADDRLEDLTSAQKQLLRMGPRNVRVVKARLRAIALALGIPSSHLPAR